MSKLPLLDLYRLVDTCLQGYDPQENKQRVQILNQQVALYYPKLAGILAPSLDDGSVVPPARWQEPLVQYHVKVYRNLVYKAGQTKPSNCRLEEDPVYAGISNPAVREAIQRRKMNEKTYKWIRRLLQEQEQEQLALPSISSSRAMTLPSSTGLAKYKEVEKALDNLSPALLAIESGLTEHTVKKLKARGIPGSSIVDLASIVKHNETSSESVQRLIQANVDDWEAVIEVAWRVQCSVKFILLIMYEVGTRDAYEISGLVGDAWGQVRDYADEHRLPIGAAWYRLFQIYAKEGRGNMEKSLELFDRQATLYSFIIERSREE